MSAQNMRSTLFLVGAAAVLVAFVFGMQEAPMTQPAFTWGFCVSGLAVVFYRFADETEGAKVVFASTAFASASYLFGLVFGSDIPVADVWYVLSAVAMLVGASLYCIKLAQWILEPKVQVVPTQRPRAKVLHR